MTRESLKRSLLLLGIILLSTMTSVAADEALPQYDMQLAVDYAQRSYRGTADIRVPVKPDETWDSVAFHLYANLLDVTGQGKEANYLTVDAVTSEQHPLSFTQHDGVLEIKMPADKSTFTKSTFIALHLTWHGKVPEVATPANALEDMMSKGLFAQLSAKDEGYRDYGLYSFRNQILSLGTYWYPVLALRANGQWQTNVMPGPGDLSMAAAADYHVNVTVSNAPSNISIIATQAAVSGNSLEASIQNARDFPIVIGEDFTVLSKAIKIDGRNVAVSSWARRSNEEKAAQVLDVAVNALQIYSKRFGAYPWDHFTVVQSSLSGGAGGAEFSGLAMMAQALYADLDQELEKQLGPLDVQNGSLGVLAKQQMDSLKSLLETSVAHETAHQWWAIGVGSDVRRAPWLDESLTNYCAMLYYKDRYGAAQYAKMVQINLTQPYQMARLLGSPDVAVAEAVDQFQNDLQYGAIVYGKGALYYQALQQLVGDAAFDSALQKYFSQYRGKMATDADLLQAFSSTDAAQAEAIKALHQHWIQEQHGDADIGTLSFGDLLGGVN